MQEDFQTVCRLDPDYPDGFFKLIDPLTAVDDVGGDNTGHHEDVVEEEEVFGKQLALADLTHTKHSLGEEAPVSLYKALTTWTKGVFNHLHSVARLFLMSRH